MRTTSVAIARALSVVGHPLVVVPAAVVTLVSQARTPSPVSIVIIVCTVAGAVVAFSIWQVRRGRWRDTDASAPPERRSLNTFLAVILLLAAAVAYFRADMRALALGLGLTAALILAAIVSSRWLKVSLHASFAAFATALLWPLNILYVVIGAVVAAGVSWARVALGRHTLMEVVTGLLLGVAFGAGFWAVLGANG